MRIIASALMVAALAAVLYLDGQLDQADLTDTAFERFLGRQTLPPGLLLLGVFLVLIVLAGREWGRVLRAKQVRTDGLAMTTGACGVATLIYLLPEASPTRLAMAIVVSWLAVILWVAMIRLSWGGRIQGAVIASACTLLGAFYLCVGPAFYLLIRQSHSVWIVAGVIAVTKSCDIGAYFTGRAIGRHKLIVWLSPGKTWEGLLGGVFCSGAVCVALVAFCQNGYAVGWWADNAGVGPLLSYPLGYAAMSGIVLGLTGQLGDLTVSLFKRDAGLKDAGQAVPGFGGVLDVIDSPILAAPVGYWLLTIHGLIN